MTISWRAQFFASGRDEDSQGGKREGTVETVPSHKALLSNSYWLFALFVVFFAVVLDVEDLAAGADALACFVASSRIWYSWFTSLTSMIGFPLPISVTM